MLLHFKNPNEILKYLMLALVFMLLIGNAITTEAIDAAATNETLTKAGAQETSNNNKTLENKTQKSVKKDLKVNLTDETVVEITPPAKDDHTEKLVIIDEKSLIETTGKAIEQQQPVQEAKEGAPQSYQNPHENEEFVLNDADDMADSLKTGFYFFLILSSAAIVFILFKIYRLRLSRAERKYGVQGDRSTQELTPLPISIEDGHSDDEDETLFEVQRQNIRIL
ncbi:uncharacterized protein ACRADG_010490 [Cochliomyia hominivorax]